MGAAQATTGPGNDYNLILKTNGVAHAAFLGRLTMHASVQQMPFSHNRDGQR
jgi:hypothetical protein